MTAQKVTLILDEGDAQLNQLTQGSVSIAPSARLPDPSDDLIVGQAPVTAQFRLGSVPQVQLVGTDQVGPQPDGWTYTITYSGVPGSPSSWSFFLRFSDGATQRLSELATVPAVQPGAQYLPLPAGPATAGYVPTATGAGEGSVWGPNGTGGSGYPALPAVSGTPSAGQVLTATSPTAADWQTPAGGGSGTVTSVSVATANGFAGTVATPSTTPALTLKTTVTGLLKGNGTGVSAAAAGTDYLTPSGSGAALTGITAAQVGADSSGAAATAQANAEAASVAKAGDTMTGHLAPAVVALTDAATIAVDASLGNDMRVTLGGNRTMGAPSNPVNGQVITFGVQQDATGSRTLTWTSGAGGYSFGTDGAPVLTTTASAVDTIGFRYHSGLGKWICLGWKLGFS